jgi:hypothetical protein
MSTLIGRVVLFLVIITLVAKENPLPEIEGLYDRVFYHTMHNGCENTPYQGNPSGFLCPPLPDDINKHFNGVFFPPGPNSRNGCIVVRGPQPDVEIDADGGHWRKYYGCRFVEIMAIADVVGNTTGYTRLSDHTITGDYCPLLVTQGTYGHCTGTPP